MRETVLTPQIIADPKTKYGNAKGATRAFFLQRLTGAINVVFIGFLVFVVVRLAGGDRAEMVAVIGNGWVGLPLALLFAIVCTHMRIGMREIIEDYVHDERTNRMSLSLNSFVAIAIGVVGALSILKLVFWG